MKYITFCLEFKNEENENITEEFYKILYKEFAEKIKGIRWGTFSIDEIEKQEMRVGQMSELCNKLSLENTRLRIENERLNKKLSSI